MQLSCIIVSSAEHRYQHSHWKRYHVIHVPLALSAGQQQGGIPRVWPIRPAHLHLGPAVLLDSYKCEILAFHALHDTMTLSRQSNAAANKGLASALADAREAYAKRNPKSLELYQKATESLPGGGTRTTLVVDPFPLMIESGQGSTITDVDGHQYKDL